MVCHDLQPLLFCHCENMPLLLRLDQIITRRLTCWYDPGTWGLAGRCNSLRAWPGTMCPSTGSSPSTATVKWAAGPRSYYLPALPQCRPSEMGSVNQELKLIQNKYSLPQKVSLRSSSHPWNTDEWRKAVPKSEVAAVTLTWHRGSEAFRIGLWEPSGKV